MRAAIAAAALSLAACASAPPAEQVAGSAATPAPAQQATRAPGTDADRAQPRPAPLPAPAISSEPLSYGARIPSGWIRMDRNYLIANPAEVERSRSEALAAGESGAPVLTLLERIETGALDLYFLPNRRAQDILEVTQALGPFPGNEDEADANCKRLRLLAGAGGQEGRNLACTLTQFGPNPVFIIQDRESQGPTELTFFHLRRGPEQLLVLAARLERRGALAHTGSIREFIASIRFPR